ncbi:MAG TPA: hypothetical protein VIM61_16325 [Chthoniobacterales bacterium]
MEIIDEIRHLSPGEQARVVLFVRQLDAGRQWTGPELSEAAATMTAETDPTKARASWERIAAGFYGKEPDA